MKRMGMFVLALVLTLAALAVDVQTAAAVCQKPPCFASPGCCFNWQCDSWCGGLGLGICGGECCSCKPAES
jgi:hypothetical protein